MYISWKLAAEKWASLQVCSVGAVKRGLLRIIIPTNVYLRLACAWIRFKHEASAIPRVSPFAEIAPARPARPLRATPPRSLSAVRGRALADARDASGGPTNNKKKKKKRNDDDETNTTNANINVTSNSNSNISNNNYNNDNNNNNHNDNMYYHSGGSWLLPSARSPPLMRSPRSSERYSMCLERYRKSLERSSERFRNYSLYI